MGLAYNEIIGDWIVVFMKFALCEFRFRVQISSNANKHPPLGSLWH